MYTCIINEIVAYCRLSYLHFSQWDAFSMPELQNFLRILKREEEEHVKQILQRYAIARDRIQQALVSTNPGWSHHRAGLTDEWSLGGLSLYHVQLSIWTCISAINVRESERVRTSVDMQVHNQMCMHGENESWLRAFESILWNGRVKIEHLVMNGVWFVRVNVESPQDRTVCFYGDCTGLSWLHCWWSFKFSFPFFSL